MMEVAPWFAAIATAVCALELLVVRRQIQRVFAMRGMTSIAVLLLASAIALPFVPAAAWVAFAMTLLVSVRFRGSYNGGSDAMLLIVLGTHAVTTTFPSLASAVQLYAAVQLTLSYFIAGIAKLGDPAWRTGRALPILVELPHYRVPAWARSLSSSRLAIPGAYAMLVIECAFPLAWVDARIGVVLLSAGAAFHLVNAVVFGLNRFLWVWLAAYPFLIAQLV